MRRQSGLWDSWAGGRVAGRGARVWGWIGGGSPALSSKRVKRVKRVKRRGVWCGMAWRPEGGSEGLRRGPEGSRSEGVWRGIRRGPEDSGGELVWRGYGLVRSPEGSEHRMPKGCGGNETPSKAPTTIPPPRPSFLSADAGVMVYCIPVVRRGPPPPGHDYAASVLP